MSGWVSAQIKGILKTGKRARSMKDLTNQAWGRSEGKFRSTW